MTLGQALKQARVERCYDQKTMAEKLGITPQTISYYENDKKAPGINVLRRYCELFELDPAELAKLKYGTEKDHDRNE